MKIALKIKTEILLDGIIHCPLEQELVVENLCNPKIAELCDSKSAEFGETIKTLICASRIFNPNEG